MRTHLTYLYILTWLTFNLAKEGRTEASGCGEGWQVLGVQCYRVGREPASRQHAAASCRAHAAHLTSVHSGAETAFLQTLLQGGSDGVWLGLVAEDEDEDAEWSSLAGVLGRRSWRWSDGSPVSYSNWATPNHPPKSPGCISLSHLTAHWLPAPCHHLQEYVCKRPCQHCQPTNVLHLEDIDSSGSGEEVGSPGSEESLNSLARPPLAWSFPSPASLEGEHKKRKKEEEEEEEEEVVVSPFHPSTTRTECGKACGRTFYRLSTTPKAWREAREDCLAGGGGLAAAVRSVPPKLALRLGALQGPVWVGSGAPHTWTPSSLTRVKAGASRGLPDDPCRVAVPGSGRWTPAPCRRRHHYLCEYTHRQTTKTTPSTTHAPRAVHLSAPSTPRDPCAPDWLLSGGLCYRAFSTWVTWEAAQNTCINHGGHLATIGDPSEQLALRRLSLERLVASPLWVGLRRSQDPAEGFVWVDGSGVEAWVWGRGQPDQHLGREGCGALTLPSLTLQDAVCLARMPFLCEAPPGSNLPRAPTPAPAPPQDELCGDDPAWQRFGAHCYSVVGAEEPLPWWEAQRRCVEEGADLVSIHSLEENYWLQEKVMSLGVSAVWTGGRVWAQEEGYRWMDASPLAFSNWAPGEPNNVHDQEDCLALYTRRQGYWNDQNCGTPEGRVCKRPVGDARPVAPAPTLTTTTATSHYCHPGWTAAPGGKCYKYFGEPRDFVGARDACRRAGRGGDLASVHTSAQAAYLTMLGGGGAAGAWLGLRRQVRGFLWVDQTPVRYTRWAAGEPSGAQVMLARRRRGQAEECVEMLTQGRAGLWNDLTCSERRPFLCQSPQDPRPVHPITPSSSPAPPESCPPTHHHYQRQGEHCYLAVNTPLTWQAAEDTCAGEGAHLATVRTRGEAAAAWVSALEAELKDPWLGLHRQDETKDFTWSSGWPLLHAPWSNNNNKDNSNNNTEGSCVGLLSSSGEWVTVPCSSPRPFLCQLMIDLPGVSVSVETASNPCPDPRWLDFGGAHCYLVVREPRPWHDARHT
ncbi:C-type mannose receptor 2-like [Eriocheir sinensis]|uniref:C-type mannose receptor 2-like n=1 Tax=Eriocheir sinensis TaxID=95602 RepID=UPI0021C68256|nr:C-type mannose receptor 2-like [Eriocheir sinensis]